MSDTLRLRGQEVQVRMTQGKSLLRTLTAIESLTWIVKMDILRKGYLGETTDRRDDIYRGSAVEMTFDPESKEPFVLVRTLVDRAQRRVAQAGAQVNVVFVCNFPDGTRPRVTLPDLKFQDPTFSVAGRDSYSNFRFNMETEDFLLSGV